MFSGEFDGSKAIIDVFSVEYYAELPQDGESVVLDQPPLINPVIFEQDHLVIGVNGILLLLQPSAFGQIANP
jgi:hypothetical protein